MKNIYPIIAPIDVLLIEDSHGDVELTKEAFRDANGAVHLHVATDGEEAMAFLRKEGKYFQVPRPKFILLDLHLPKMDGREILALIKKDEKLKSIPVIILSTSEDEEDVRKSYDLHANCFLTKPIKYAEFESLVRHINDFWINTHWKERKAA